MFVNLFVISAFLLSFVSQALGHAAVAPMLGVAGTPKRSDVQRPSTAKVCGSAANLAAIDTSTAVVAAADGTFKMTATSFNGGGDGSRSFTAQVSADGTGKTFAKVTMVQNGLAAPAAAGSQAISAQLAAGTKCVGGKTKNKCLVQFKSTAGFGNCVVVQQAAAVAAAKPKRTVGGTRAARALLSELEQRGEDLVEVVKRKASGWIWA